MCIHCLPKAGWPEREVPEAVGSRKTDENSICREFVPPVMGREKLASGDGGGGGGGGGAAFEQVKQRRVEARGWRWLPFSLGLGKTILSSEPLDSN